KATWMKGASRMYVQQTLWDTPNVTSSQESAAGRMPSGSPDGPTTGPYGPDPALASLTPRQALEAGMTTRGPYGGHGVGSSTSVDLQLSLASRLRALMDVDGSPEYELTWSQWDMPWGPPIFRLRASARRISGKGFGLSPKGWTTPQAHDGSPRGRGQKARHGTKHGCADLNRDAQMAGWRTPSGSDGEGGTMDIPMAMREGYTPKLKLRDQAPLASGAMQSGSPAPTERRGALNPALSLWLMGYPDEWLSCGVRAMQSSRRLRRCS